MVTRGSSSSIVLRSCVGARLDGARRRRRARTAGRHVQVRRRPRPRQRGRPRPARGGSSRICRRATSKCSTAGSAAADRRFPDRLARRQRRAAVRRQRQHGSAAGRTRAKRPTHVLSWLDDGRDEAAIFTFDTRLDEVAPFTAGLKALPASMSTVDAVRRDVAARRDRRRRPSASATREGRRRAVVVLTDGGDNASRLTPAEVSAHRQRDRRAGLHLRRRPVDRQSRSDTVARRRREHSSLAGALDRSGDVDRRPRVRRQHAGRSAASRRGRSSTSCGISISIAFESSGKPGWHPLVVRAREQGPRRSSPEWICRGAISPEFGLGGSSHVAEILDRCSRLRSLAVGGVDRVRHQEVRADERRRSERQGRLARPVASRRRRSARARTKAASPRSIRRPQAAGAGGRRRPTTAADAGTPRTRPTKADDAGSKVDAHRQGEPSELVFEVVLSEDQGNFKFGKTELPDEAKAEDRRDGRSS